MNDTPPVPPRRRLQELLAIPERLRTEAQWDELHELEISLAPGNRADAESLRPRMNEAPRPRQNHPSSPPRSRPGPGSSPHEGGDVKKPFRKRHRKPAKSGGAGGAGEPGEPGDSTE